MFVCPIRVVVMWISRALVGICVNGDARTHSHLVDGDGTVFFFLRAYTFGFCGGDVVQCSDGEGMMTCLFV